MVRAFKLAELRAISDEDLVALHDKTTENVVVGVNYLLDELRRREVDRSVAASQRLARRSYWLTVANSFFALASVAVAVAAIILTR